MYSTQRNNKQLLLASWIRSTIPMKGASKDKVIVRGELIQWRIEVSVVDKATSLIDDNQGVHAPNRN